MVGLQCIWWMILGGIAGTLAGRLIRGKGYGIIGDIGLGLAGSLVGGVLLGWRGGPLVQIIVSLLGAVIFVLVVRIFVDSEFAR